MSTTSAAHTLDQASRTALREKADGLRWFHAIDFGDFQTRGRFRDGPPNHTLYPVFDILGRIDVRGLRCLDIGAFAGLVSYGLLKLGAASVAATDVQDRPTFRLAGELLGLEVDYHPGRVIADLHTRFEPESFDLIICAGVLYHMLDPAHAFTECRRLLRPGGLLLLETAFHAGLDGPTMILNSETDLYSEPTTYWLPSRQAVEGMARLACFDVLESVELLAEAPQYARLGVACRACAPDEIRDRTPALERIHKHGVMGIRYRPTDLTAWRDSSTTPAPHRGEGGSSVIDAGAYTPEFPLHAHTLHDPVGLVR